MTTGLKSTIIIVIRGGKGQDSNPENSLTIISLDCLKVTKPTKIHWANPDKTTGCMTLWLCLHVKDVAKNLSFSMSTF